MSLKSWPDVGEAGRRQGQSLDADVGHRVGVGVAVQAALLVEAHSSQHQRPFRVVAVAVHVEPLPHPNTDISHG